MSPLSVGRFAGPVIVRRVPSVGGSREARLQGEVRRSSGLRFSRHLYVALSMPRILA